MSTLPRSSEAADAPGFSAPSTPAMQAGAVVCTPQPQGPGPAGRAPSPQARPEPAGRAPGASAGEEARTRRGVRWGAAPVPFRVQDRPGNSSTGSRSQHASAGRVSGGHVGGGHMLPRTAASLAGARTFAPAHLAPGVAGASLGGERGRVAGDARPGTWCSPTRAALRTPRPLLPAGPPRDAGSGRRSRDSAVPAASCPAARRPAPASASWVRVAGASTCASVERPPLFFFFFLSKSTKLDTKVNAGETGRHRDTANDTKLTRTSCR